MGAGARLHKREKTKPENLVFTFQLPENFWSLRMQNPLFRAVVISKDLGVVLRKFEYVNRQCLNALSASRF